VNASAVRPDCLLRPPPLSLLWCGRVQECTGIGEADAKRGKVAADGGGLDGALCVSRERDSSDDESDNSDGEQEGPGDDRMRGGEGQRAGAGLGMAALGLNMGLGPWDLMARGGSGRTENVPDTRLLLSAPCMLVKLKGVTPGHLEVLRSHVLFVQVIVPPDTPFDIPSASSLHQARNKPWE
jgi:hypothetical protein